MPRSQPLLGILSQFRDEWPHGFKKYLLASDNNDEGEK